MPDECPTDCKHDRIRFDQSIKELFEMAIPVWLRNLAVMAILTLFAANASVWAYGFQTYMTRAELAQSLEQSAVASAREREILRIRVERTEAALDQHLAAINRKLDKLLQQDK